MISIKHLAGIACLTLGGCLGGGDVTRLGTSPFWFRATAPAFVTIPETQIVVRGPRGYCVDPESRQQAGSAHFMRLGSCASLANSRLAGAPDKLAVLTATVSAPGGGNIADFGAGLVDYFQSDAGRARLARSGKAEDVTIASADWASETLIMSAEDKSNPSATSDTRWRAMFDVQGRLLTVTVTGAAGKRLSGDAARNLLDEFVAAIRGANGISVSESSNNA